MTWFAPSAEKGIKNIVAGYPFISHHPPPNTCYDKSMLYGQGTFIWIIFLMKWDYQYIFDVSLNRNSNLRLLDQWYHEQKMPK